MLRWSGLVPVWVAGNKAGYGALGLGEGRRDIGRLDISIRINVQRSCSRWL